MTVGALATSLVGASAACAAVVDFTFTGTVTGIQGVYAASPFGAADPTGDTYTAFYSVDTSKALIIDNGNILDFGPYNGVPSVITASLTIGGRTLSLGGNTYAGQVYGYTGGLLVSAQDLDCRIATCDAIQGAATGPFSNPINPLAPSNLSSTSNNAGGYQHIEGNQAVYSIFFGPSKTAITVDGVSASVPEPSAWAMMLIGVAVVGAGQRFARRRLASTAT